MIQTTQETVMNQMNKCNKKKMKDGAVTCKGMMTSKMMMTPLGKLEKVVLKLLMLLQ
jgi:hypothetical protein